MTAYNLYDQLEEVRQLVVLKHQAGRHAQSTHTPKKYGAGGAPTTQAELAEYIAYRKGLGHDKDLNAESQGYWDMVMDDIKPLDLKDKQGEIDPVTASWAHGTHMRGYLITPDDKLSGISDEFSGGTNDHVGNMLLSSNPGAFGVSDKQANNAMADYMDMSGAAEGYLTETWATAMKAGTVRVREFGDNTSVQSAYMDDRTLKRMQRLYDQDKFMVNWNGDVVWEDFEGRGNYVNVSAKDFMSASSVGELRRNAHEAW